jgi:hypothetical protein
MTRRMRLTPSQLSLSPAHRPIAMFAGLSLSVLQAIDFAAE